MDYLIFYVYFLFGTSVLSFYFLPNSCVPWAKTNVDEGRWRERCLGRHGLGGAGGRRGGMRKTEKAGKHSSESGLTLKKKLMRKNSGEPPDV